MGEIITAYNEIPYAVLGQDIEASYRQDFFLELGHIVQYYKTYAKGAEFLTEGANGEYVPSNLKFKKVKTLIDKEARFLFSRTPDITVNPTVLTNKTEKEKTTILNDYVSSVITKNNLANQLLKAAKDCFIGKRVAFLLNFSIEYGITVSFLNSLEFFYEYDVAGKLSKFVAFQIVRQHSDSSERRIHKKVYDIGEDGYCYAYENLYNGMGTPIEGYEMPRTRTEFNFVPAYVILNDGLTGDSKGESEVEVLYESEAVLSKLSNSDIDAGRKSMNPVRWVSDADEGSTENLTAAPGAFWDLHSDENSSETRTVKVGLLEPSMNYSAPLKTTIDRVENSMYSQLDIPNINGEKLQGVITSGKTLSALYWDLTVRCDEKMLVWRPALEFMTMCIIEGGKLYPEIALLYSNDPIPDTFYEVLVDNNYPLPEDEQEEKQTDMSEVAAQTMSRKSYMIKWRKLTPEEADEELQQILLEKQLFDDALLPQTQFGQPVTDATTAQVDTSTTTDPALDIIGTGQSV